MVIMSAVNDDTEIIKPEDVQVGRGRYPRIDGEKWAKMLQAYSQKPTKANVMLVADVGEKLADRAIHRGWPELGLLPFKEIVQDQQAIYSAMGAYRKRSLAVSLARVEGTRQMAQEGLAIETALVNATRAGELLERVLDQVLQGVSAGKIKIPEILDEKYLMALARSAQSVSAAVEKAIASRKLHGLKPQDPVGKEITELLSRCTPEELEEVRTTGTMPRRLLGAVGSSARDHEFEDDGPLPESLEGSTSDPMSNSTK
jgi:hypothetical protein